MEKSSLRKISNQKYEFETEAMAVPVVFHLSEELLPDEETFNQLENLGKDSRLFHHIAAMSDIHPKKGRKNPTGTVVASQKYLFPQINDTAPNCGMRLIKTNLNSANFPKNKIDELFQLLVKTVPTKKRIGTKVPYQTVLEICKKGVSAVCDHFQTRTRHEVENSFELGNFLREENLTNREITDVIPSLFLRIGRYRLGILGAAGNHFLDLMEITEIKDSLIAEKFGLSKGQYVFLLHTGSGLLGQYASYMYTPKVKEHFSQKLVLRLGTLFFSSQLKKAYLHLASKIKEYVNKKEFFGYEDNSLEGRMLIRAHRASANFGFANRSVITHHVEQALEKALGHPAELELLYDTTHISMLRENHFGEDVWIHRNGAVRANGPKRMGYHPIFSQTGEPVFLPSSMSTPAYICVGTDENESSFFSASHGTGRRKNATSGAATNKKELLSKMENSKVKLYNAESKGVVLQDSAYYKDVEEVIKGMEENKVIKAVARMQPVAVLMY